MVWQIFLLPSNFTFYSDINLAPLLNFKSFKTNIRNSSSEFIKFSDLIFFGMFAYTELGAWNYMKCHTCNHQNSCCFTDIFAKIKANRALFVVNFPFDDKSDDHWFMLLAPGGSRGGWPGCCWFRNSSPGLRPWSCC